VPNRGPGTLQAGRSQRAKLLPAFSAGVAIGRSTKVRQAKNDSDIIGTVCPRRRWNTRQAGTKKSPIRSFGGYQDDSVAVGICRRFLRRLPGVTPGSEVALA